MRILLIVLALAGVAVANPVRKPSAPVEVSIDSKPLVNGYALTLVAVPTRAVPSLELELAGRTVTFGPTAAGQRRTITAWVPVATGTGLDVIGGARLAGRNKAAVLHVGAIERKAPKRSVIRTLPDGREIEEVR